MRAPIIQDPQGSRAANKAEWAARRPKPKGANARKSTVPPDTIEPSAGVTAKPTAKPRKSQKPDVRYSQEIAVRTALGESLRTISADPAMPTMQAITEWQRQYPEFAAQIDRARTAWADSRIEEIHDLTAKVLRGELDPHAARVGLDNLWKLASRENWNRWGDRQALAVAMQVAPGEAAGASTAATDEFIRCLNRLAERGRLLGEPETIADGVDLAPTPEPPPPTKTDTIRRVPDRLVDMIPSRSRAKARHKGDPRANLLHAAPVHRRKA